MNYDLLDRESNFQIGMSMARSMLNAGIFSERDYLKIESALAEKYKLAACNISLINKSFRGNMSPANQGGDSVGKGH